MKTKLKLFLTLLSFCTLHFSFSTASAQGTAFTYQGQLSSNGFPLNGNYDFQFSLYPNAAGTGSPLGASPITQAAMGVTNGLFTTTLDFGAVFTGNATWLAISVRSNNIGSYTALAPLQELTPTPYAIYTPNAGSAAIATTANNVASGIDITNALITNSAFGGNGGGLTNLNAAQLTSIGNNSFAEHNFFIGQAGNASVSGFYNTGMGYAALLSDTTGANNAAFGANALIVNNSGFFNTADGSGSLSGNTSGSANTAAGFQALQHVSTGSNNIALGYQAGNNFSGNETSNIDIGNLGVFGENNIIRIGSNQTTAYIAGVITGNGGGLANLNVSTAQLTGGANENVYVGPAGNTITSGSDNTAAGALSLSANSSGSGNTGIGFQTLYNNSSGNNNTAIGYQALLAVGFDGANAASNNIAVGYEAGASINSGSSNIDIGNPGLPTDANIIRIGSNQTTAYIAGVITGNGGGLANLNVSTAQLTGGANENVYVGPAGNTITSGSDNTAAGALSLSANSSGSGNTGIGFQTLYNNSSGNNNTALGYQALLAVGFDGANAASNNIAVGYKAGASINSGSSNIDIGNPGLSTDANIIRIGSNQTAAYIAGTINGSGLNITTTAGTLAVVADQNAVPGITATGGLASGHMRLRNALEVWPDNAQANAGYLDVRNTANNATISLTGSSGAIVCSNVTANGVVLTSDRNAKQNFTALDAEATLAKVSAMPVTEWSYKSDPASTKHIGPMAQDFHAAFGLNGTDDKHISVVDEGGVALAAIQGLNQKLEKETKAKDAEIEALKQSVADLKKIVQALTEKR